MYVLSKNMSSTYSLSPNNDMCHSDPYYSTNVNYYTNLFPADSQNSGKNHYVTDTNQKSMT